MTQGGHRTRECSAATTAANVGYLT